MFLDLKINQFQFNSIKSMVEQLLLIKVSVRLQKLKRRQQDNNEDNNNKFNVKKV